MFGLALIGLLSAAFIKYSVCAASGKIVYAFIVALAVAYICWRSPSDADVKTIAPIVVDYQSCEVGVLCNAPPSLPRGSRYLTNSADVIPFENDMCSGEFLFVHKPTGNPSIVASGTYPYSAHIHGRKRLWEMRWHFRMKKELDGTLWFGLEQDKYYWPGYFQYKLGQSVVSAMRKIVGEVYQTVGEDPSRNRGEVERPALAFPLWVLDQLIITPEGQEPPELTDPNFPTLGITKSHDRKAFQKAIDELTLKPGPTFTVALWCVARFGDWITWTIAAPMIPRTSLTEIGIHPPIFLVYYVLKSADDPKDQRHMDSKKDYLFRIASWSSMAPASQARQQELLEVHQGRINGSRSNQGKTNGSKQLFGQCCWSR